MGERWTDAFVLQESETPDELVLYHDQSPRSRRFRLGAAAPVGLFVLSGVVQTFLSGAIGLSLLLLAELVLVVPLFLQADRYSISVSIADDTAVFDYQWFVGRRRKTVDLTDAFRATPKRLSPGVSIQSPEGKQTVRFTTTPLRTRTGKQVKDRIAVFINSHLN